MRVAVVALAVVRGAGAAARRRAGRPEQGAARRVSGRRDRLRSAGDERRLFRPTSNARSSIRCTRYDILARPYKIVPNTAAALPEISPDGLTWTMRDQAGHLLQRRSGVQGEEARADGRRLHLFVEAHARSEDALAAAADVRRHVRRRGRAGREGEGDRQVRLRRADGGPAGARPLHDPDQARASGLRPAAQPDDGTVVRGGARSHRSVRRRQRLGDAEPGRHRAVPAQGMAARPEDRARGESGVSRSAVSGQRRSRGPRDRGEVQGQAAAADRQDRHQHHRGIQSAAAGVREGRPRLHPGAAGSRAERPRRRTTR